MPSTVTLPVFLTVTLYVTVSSTPGFALVLSDVLVTSIAAFFSTAVTVTLASSVTSASLGSFPVAVTVLSILPASTSA